MEQEKTKLQLIVKENLQLRKRLKGQAFEIPEEVDITQTVDTIRSFIIFFTSFSSYYYKEYYPN